VAVEQDIWIVGAPEVNCGRDVDRVTFAQLGITPRATDPNAQQARAITDALAARYGISTTRLRDDYLARATTRSRSGEGELIIFPRTMTLEQAMALISPERAVS
jgi:hypothetical protein